MTSALARHKRGFNCKKSCCLKKYCECYQGGVGCTIYYRCDRCKNAFGRKDNSALVCMDIEQEVEVEAASDKSGKNKRSQKAAMQVDNAESVLLPVPATPSRFQRAFNILPMVHVHPLLCYVLQYGLGSSLMDHLKKHAESGHSSDGSFTNRFQPLIVFEILL